MRCATRFSDTFNLIVYSYMTNRTWLSTGISQVKLDNHNSSVKHF